LIELSKLIIESKITKTKYYFDISYTVSFNCKKKVVVVGLQVLWLPRLFMPI
jgi:hypothetical protein